MIERGAVTVEEDCEDQRLRGEGVVARDGAKGGANTAAEEDASWLQLAWCCCLSNTRGLSQCFKIKPNTKKA